MKNAKLLWILMMALALVIAGCGKKEEAPATPQVESAQAPAGPATSIDAATAGAVTGKASFAGGKPSPRAIRMDAEPACKSLHTSPVYSEDMVLNDNGTLQYVFVYVKEGLGSRTFDTPKNPVTLDQKGCIYRPHVVGVQTGQEVHVLNSDPTTHNIHPLPKNNREWNVSQPPKAEKIVQSFPREELLIPVKCNVHPWMRSYIGVLKHPFFAVTGQDGAFELKGLPPGEYVVAAWHEKLGTQEQKVTVGPKETKTVDFTFKAAGGM